MADREDKGLNEMVGISYRERARIYAKLHEVNKKTHISIIYTSEKIKVSKDDNLKETIAPSVKLHLDQIRKGQRTWHGHTLETQVKQIKNLLKQQFLFDDTPQMEKALDHEIEELMAHLH